MQTRTKGDILKKLRVNANLTQKELGDIVGVTDSTIRMIELNKRTGNPTTTRKLAEFFEISVDELEGKTVDNINAVDNKYNTQQLSFVNDLAQMLAKSIDIDNIDSNMEKLIVNAFINEIKRIKEKEENR